MRRSMLLLTLLGACTAPPASTPAGSGPTPATDGAYRVLRMARVGGEGGTDYIYAEPTTRRLYIPRGGARAVPATADAPAKPAVAGRITVYDLDNLTTIGEIPETGGNGVAVDVKSGHGFSSSKPVSMFDTRTLTVIKKIDVGDAQPDGILADAYNGRVYVFSHPTKNAVVIDAKDGTVVGTIDLGGVPEQAVADGKGTMYVIMQDSPGSVTVVDVKSMKATAHYAIGDKGGCNGLPLDAKNLVLFVSCARSGIVAGAPPPPPGPPQAAVPMMVVLSAKDGKILANLPLAGGSDGGAFNAATMEAYSTHGNGTLTIVKEKNPTTFEVEQNLTTMNGARTITFDPKTQRIYTMSVERGPAPPPPPGGGRGGQAPAIPGSFTIVVVGKP